MFDTHTLLTSWIYEKALLDILTIIVKGYFLLVDEGVDGKK